MQMINKRSTEFRMRSLWQCHKLRSISAKKKIKREIITSLSHRVIVEKLRQYISEFWLCLNHHVNGRNCYSYLHRHSCNSIPR